MDEPSQPPNLVRGIATTEFWTAVFTVVAAIAAQFFHRDLGPQVQALAVLAAGITTFGYQISRAFTKSAHLTAVADLQSKTLEADTERARLNAEFPPPRTRTPKASKELKELNE